MSRLSPEAQEVVGRAGLLKIAEQRIDNALAVRRIIDILVREHQATPGDDLNRVSATSEELCRQLFGSDLEELVDYTATLLGVGRNSPVQRTLNGGGYRLCPTRKRIDVQGSDGVLYKARSFAARFVTRDDDLIFDTLVETQADSLKNAALRKGDLMRLIQESHPQLAARLARRMAELQGDIERGLALPSPDESESSGKEEADRS